MSDPFPPLPPLPPPSDLPRPLTSVDVALWLATHFDPPASDLAPCPLEDFSLSPPFSLRNADLQDWMARLHAEWPRLARCVAGRVKEHPERHTLLWAPHPLVVPGGRFREAYLWDSLWIAQGLVRSGLHATAAGLARNIVHAIQQLGFAPNGGRTYLTRRSQPPLSSSIVWEVVRATGDVGLLAEALPALELDYAWWMRGEHAVAVPLPQRAAATLNRYASSAREPRAESWKEDAAAASGLSEEAAAALYGDIAAAAESGLDFSSRWLRAPGLGGMADTATSSVVPVELNAELLVVERHLAEAAATLAAREEWEGGGGRERRPCQRRHR